ncbi:MAG: hypothetical protein IKU23_02340 [Clostridia bacterium]|nr:hypothetical protein [Clostridia bacterium]
MKKPFLRLKTKKDWAKLIIFLAVSIWAATVVLFNPDTQVFADGKGYNISLYGFLANL